MPWTYRIDPSRRVIVRTFSGALTDQDLEEHRRALRADPEFASDYDQFSDYLGVTEMRVTADMIRTLAGTRIFDPGIRCAIVAADDLAYGFARMYQLGHEDAGEHVRIFRNREDALEWLGLEEGALRGARDHKP
ncbi:MAG: hypothetical protein OXT09_10125 [Myxococcales bacterium]|nr:hypothetical protein [Myxococcales bacterium]